MPVWSLKVKQTSSIISLRKRRASAAADWSIGGVGGVSGVGVGVGVGVVLAAVRVRLHFLCFSFFFSFGVLLISSSATEFQFQSLGPVPGPVPGPLSVDAIFRMNESVAEEIDDLCRFFGIFFLFTESDLRGPP